MDRSPLRQLGSGPALLAFRDVSAKMRPETALLRSVSTPSAFRVLEQNFDFDLLTPQKLLERYVGKNVTVVGTNPATGVETTESATVLAANGGVVLQMGQRIETGVPGRLVFGDVPANLATVPPWSWAWTIACIYEVFPLLCPNCGGQMRLIAFITEGSQIKKILDHIGVDSDPPHISTARGPPLWEGCDAQMGDGVQSEPDWDLAAKSAPDYEVDQRISW